MVRILLADDHEVVRQGLRHLLERPAGWAICGEAATGREAVAMAAELKPDVAVLDVAMPDLNGLDATRQIRKASPRTEVLAFTMHESEALVREALAAGAKGYLLKSDAGLHIVAAVEALASGKTYFNAKVSATIVEGFLRAAAANAPRAERQLTSREREVMQLLAEGCSNKEVATRLSISLKTAEAHRGAIMRKLEARSLADIVRYAMRNGITPP
ncbi:response regulator [Falsiroseomonas oryzae]|uniref:response regulator n=1 Tax=Falsiroseomonas oryzae TaxID=2766473 RepID=UPI0022EAFD88|nr:response regulator transcription factor [Roseomonas sp. MO-31]